MLRFISGWTQGHCEPTLHAHTQACQWGTSSLPALMALPAEDGLLALTLAIGVFSA